MTDQPTIPDCMESLGGDRYRCRDRGWVLEITVFPLHCNCHRRSSPATTEPAEITAAAAAERLAICENCPTGKNQGGQCVLTTSCGNAHRQSIDQMCRWWPGCPEFHW